MKSFSFSAILALVSLPFFAGCDAPSASSPTATPQEISLQKIEEVPSLFVEALAPFGRWLQNDRYGYVWQPKVAADWRPFTVGSWAFTDYGLTWVSAEPFGWVTFHYGRWAHLEKEGWVWVPGEQWAPSWVAWRHDDEAIGWAPLPPESGNATRLIEGNVDERFSIPPSSYVAVPAAKFAEKELQLHLLPQFQFSAEKFPNKTLIMVSRSVVTVYGPDISFLRNKTQAPLEVLKIERIGYRSDREPLPMIEKGKIYFTAPPVEATAKEKPPVASESSSVKESEAH